LSSGAVTATSYSFGQFANQSARNQPSGGGEHLVLNTGNAHHRALGHIGEALGIDLWPRFNSGLVLLPREAVDLPLAEKLVTAFRTTAHHPQFFEQTLYGLMASAWGLGGALPPAYEISWGYLRQRGAVCRHYVGDFKYDLLYIEAGAAMLVSGLKNALSSKN
jgi:hypothetical protein